MESPLGLADRLQVTVSKAKDGKELFQLLLALPVPDQIEFFQYGADDQTWVEEKGGEDYMALAIPHFTEANLKNVIPKDLLQRVAESLQTNIRHLFYYMPEDIGFIVHNYRFPGNSLLFRFIGGEYFSNMIDDYVISRNIKDIALKGVKIRVFHYLKEFVYMGQMEDLWKEDPKIILSLQRRGNKWRMKGLSDTAFRTFKNYISKEVLFKRLIAAFEERNIHMTEELLVELEKEDLGFKLELQETGFTLVLHKLDEEIEKMLAPFAPHIYTLKVPEERIEEPSLQKLLQKCSHLEMLDLSTFKECSEPLALIESLPERLQILVLHDLRWVDDTIFEAVVKHCSQLNQLDLSGCDRITPTLLTEIGHMPRLESVKLAHFHAIDEQILLIVATLWSRVRDLDLSDTGVDDASIGILIKCLPEIRDLSLNGCRKVTQDGVLQLTVCKTLRKLDVRGTSIPPDFIAKQQFRFFNVTFL